MNYSELRQCGGSSILVNFQHDASFPFRVQYTSYFLHYFSLLSFFPCLQKRREGRIVSYKWLFATSAEKWSLGHTADSR